jgi:hypothetical protein
LQKFWVEFKARTSYLDVQQAIDEETKERKTGDNQLNQKIDDMDFDLNEKLSKEVNDRNSQIKLLQQEIKEEADKQRKFVNDFRDKVLWSQLGHRGVQPSDGERAEGGQPPAVAAGRQAGHHQQRREDDPGHAGRAREVLKEPAT